MKPVLVLRHVAHEGLGTIADALVRQQAPYSIVDMFAQPPRTFEPRDVVRIDRDGRADECG